MIQSFIKPLTSSTPIRNSYSKLNKATNSIEFDFSLLDYDPPLTEFVVISSGMSSNNNKANNYYNHYHESFKKEKKKKFDLREFCRYQLQHQQSYLALNKKSTTIRIKIKKKK